MTGPWALAHWARGPWPIGPWALAHWAHGPWPIGPWPIGASRGPKISIFQKVWEWLPLVWKMSGYLGGVFLSYLEAPNSHIVKNLKIVKTIFFPVFLYIQLLLNWPVAALQWARDPGRTPYG